MGNLLDASPQRVRASRAVGGAIGLHGILMLSADLGSQPQRRFGRLAAIDMKPDTKLRTARPCDAESVTALLRELGCTAEEAEVRGGACRGSTTPLRTLSLLLSRTDARLA